MTENETIIQTLYFLEHGKFSERKPYIHDYMNNGVKLNGFVFQKDTWCYLIWKPTDIAKDPRFKGEPLYKAIPDNVDWKDMETVLNAQRWTYN